MTHKDFVLIASTIAKLALPTETPDTQGLRERIAQQFASNLASTNPRFDRARFIAAANGTPQARDGATVQRCYNCTNRHPRSKHTGIASGGTLGATVYRTACVVKKCDCLGFTSREDASA